MYCSRYIAIININTEIIYIIFTQIHAHTRENTYIVQYNLHICRGKLNFAYKKKKKIKREKKEKENKKTCGNLKKIQNEK